MKAYLVKKTFAPNDFAGVIFSDKKDALDAVNGGGGISIDSLAEEWFALYGNTGHIEMTEIEL